MRRMMMAAAMPPRVSDLARQTRPAPVMHESPIEQQVFGTKKYYTMQLNMPNLTSAGGSWIIRFAELNVAADSANDPPGDDREVLRKGGGSAASHAAAKKLELTAPVVTLKVDPKYPQDAIRDRIEGTVVLYAVIRKDGSVDKVRVLHGVDSRLDANACAALERWRFRPGTRNGAAVDLEAVVQIPFQARHYSF